MAAMFSFRSLGIGLPSFLWSGESWPNSAEKGLDISSVKIYDIEESPDKRERTLKHLIRANHINHAVIYHNLQFQNHASHILGSAFLLGADVNQMHAIYERESEELEEWKDAPAEISGHDWRDYLGKRDFQRAWVDFYEDQLVQHGYDWKELIDDFFFDDHHGHPLINCLITNLGHPLIHFGYALELNSPTLAIEALAVTSAFYGEQHKYLDDRSYTKPSPWSSDDPLDILDKLRQDKRFDALTWPADSNGNTDSVWTDKEKESLMLEYWNALTLHNLPSQFEATQRAAIALLVSTHKPGQKFNFFFCHVLTTSHALRIIMPLIPKKWHIPLIRQWWLLVVMIYMAQLRPEIDLAKIHDIDLKGREWKHVDDNAVNGQWKLDSHYVKASRAFKVVEETWGDAERFCLKAAVHFAENFDGWF